MIDLFMEQLNISDQMDQVKLEHISNIVQRC